MIIHPPQLFFKYCKLNRISGINCERWSLTCLWCHPHWPADRQYLEPSTWTTCTLLFVPPTSSMGVFHNVKNMFIDDLVILALQVPVPYAYVARIWPSLCLTVVGHQKVQCWLKIENCSSGYHLFCINSVDRMISCKMAEEIKAKSLDTSSARRQVNGINHALLIRYPFLPWLIKPPVSNMNLYR